MRVGSSPDGAAAEGLCSTLWSRRRDSNIWGPAECRAHRTGDEPGLVLLVETESERVESGGFRRYVEPEPRIHWTFLGAVASQTKGSRRVPPRNTYIDFLRLLAEGRKNDDYFWDCRLDDLLR